MCRNNGDKTKEIQAAHTTNVPVVVVVKVATPKRKKKKWVKKIQQLVEVKEGVAVAGPVGTVGGWARRWPAKI